MNTELMSTDFVNSLSIGTKGPVTAGRHRRNALLYTAICLLAYTPTLAHLSPGAQAAGLGLLLPGAGFLADGGWLMLLFPLTLALFWLSVVAWFWAGVVIAPLTVWLGTAILAGVLVGPQIWDLALYLAPAAAAALFLRFQYKG